MGHQVASHLLSSLLLSGRCRRGRVLFQHLIVEQAALLNLLVPEDAQLLVGGQRVLDCLVLRHGSVGGAGIGDACDNSRALDHRGLVCRLINSVLLDLGSGLGVVLGEQLRQEVVRAGRAECGDLANAGDAARSLGEVSLAVGEADGAVVAVNLHEAAQVHRLPDIVLGLALDLDAEAGVVAVNIQLIG